MIGPGHPELDPSPSAEPDGEGALSLLLCLGIFEKSMFGFLPSPRTSKSNVFSPDWTLA